MSLVCAMSEKPVISSCNCQNHKRIINEHKINCVGNYRNSKEQGKCCNNWWQKNYNWVNPIKFPIALSKTLRTMWLWILFHRISKLISIKFSLNFLHFQSYLIHLYLHSLYVYRKLLEDLCYVLACTQINFFLGTVFSKCQFSQLTIKHFVLISFWFPINTVHDSNRIHFVRCQSQRQFWFSHEWRLPFNSSVIFLNIFVLSFVCSWNMKCC